MTFYYINLMWAIVLLGILLWTTVIVVLNAAMRRGMGIMGLALSYAVLLWMAIELPWREAVVTWTLFAVAGGILIFFYEIWARRKYAAAERAPRPFVRVSGIWLWPALIPDAVGLMLNDAGVLPADERRETHQEDAAHVTTEMPIER